MIEVLNKFKHYYRQTFNSIAFYPSLIAAGFFALGLLVVWAEDYEVTNWMLDNVPSLVVDNDATARVLLSTFIGGLISLTVFSFSMVMVTLNQAASNFTPRLLPGIISSRRNQVVLGFYIGTIVYCILVLLNILPGEEAYQLPGLAIFLAIFFAVLCLALFVYFIHAISENIKVSTVLERIMRTTTKRLEQLNEQEERQRASPHFDDKDWQTISNVRTAYFRGIDANSLLKVAKQYDTVINILLLNGTYILKGLPILKSQKELNEKEQRTVLSCLIFDGDESASKNYMVGFKHITEIAVKAMSPGINDPGTAINAIDYLKHLFSIRMKLNDNVYHKDDEGNVRIFEEAVDFGTLLHDNLYSLRLYSKENAKVMAHLLELVRTLKLMEMEDPTFMEALIKEEKELLEDARTAIPDMEELSELNALE